jgi:zinc protease
MRMLHGVLSVVAFCATAHLSADPVFTASKLDNGLEVVTVENRKVPLVTIVLSVKAGAMTESKETNGLTHLWEHMFFKGNAVIPNQEEYNRRIRQLGIVYNGDTSAEKVRYYFTMPSSFVEEGIKFMFDAIATPKLEQSELERERRVVMDEYDRNAAQPGFDNERLTRTIMYGNKQYLRDPLGERPIIEKATREQLLKIKDEVMVPANSALLVAGDVNNARVVELARKYFSKWQNPKEWRRPSTGGFGRLSSSTEFVMTRPNVQNAQVKITFNGPTVRENVRDTFSADVMLTMLGNKTGKFYKKFIDSGLTFGAGMYFPTQNEAGELILYAITKPANAKKVQKMLLVETKEWQKPGYFTDVQLEDVRRSLSIDHKREVNQPTEFVKTLAFWWAITGLDYYASYLDNLRSTLLADLQKFSQNYFKDKHYVASILLSPENAKQAGLVDNSVELMKKHTGTGI